MQVPTGFRPLSPAIPYSKRPDGRNGSYKTAYDPDRESLLICDPARMSLAT